MALAPVTGAHTIKAGTTTDAINTTGADLLVVAVASGSNTVPTVSDNKGNSWNNLTTIGTTRLVRMFWSSPTSVGSGHTFSVVNGDGFHSIAATAWSGAAASPFDQESGTVGLASPGSITPVGDNELLVTALADSDAGTQTVDSGFTIIDQLGNGGTYGLAVAYLIETTATAKNPARSPANNARTAMATFKAGAGGGGGGVTVGADALHYYREHVMRGVA